MEYRATISRTMGERTIFSPGRVQADPALRPFLARAAAAIARCHIGEPAKYSTDTPVVRSAKSRREQFDPSRRAEKAIQKTLVRRNHCAGLRHYNRFTGGVGAAGSNSAASLDIDRFRSGSPVGSGLAAVMRMSPVYAIMRCHKGRKDD